MRKLSSDLNTEPTSARVRAFFADADVREFHSLYTDKSLLEIAYPKEVPQARILQWLFDPSNGHDHGDQAIRALLGAASKVAGQGIVEPAELRRLAALSWKGAVVCREYEIKGRRCDLVIANPKHQALVAIELKTGAKLSKKQLTDYKKGLSKHYKEWTLIPILLDSEERNHIEAAKSAWIALSFDWLQAFVGNLKLDRRKGAPGLKALREYASYLGRHERETDRWDELSIRIADRHASVLKWMGRLQNTDWNDAFTRVASDGVIRLDALYLRDWERWDEVIARVPQARICMPALERGLRIEYGRKNLYFNHPKWDKISKTPGEGLWPFCIQGKLDNESGLIQISTYGQPIQFLAEANTRFCAIYKSRAGVDVQRYRQITQKVKFPVVDWPRKLDESIAAVDEVFKKLVSRPGSSRSPR